MLVMEVGIDEMWSCVGGGGGGVGRAEQHMWWWWWWYWCPQRHGKIIVWCCQSTWMGRMRGKKWVEMVVVDEYRKMEVEWSEERGNGWMERNEMRIEGDE